MAFVLISDLISYVKLHHQTSTSMSTMALFMRQSPLRGLLPRELLATCTLSLNSRHFSVLNRPAPNYPGHVPLTGIEKAGLAVGSAVMSLLNPYRHGKPHFQHPNSANHSRLDSSFRRSNSNTLLYLPSARCYAFRPYRSENPT